MSSPEVIKLEFILKLKIKHNDWLLACVRNQPIIVLYFEFETSSYLGVKNSLNDAVYMRVNKDKYSECHSFCEKALKIQNLCIVNCK